MEEKIRIDIYDKERFFEDLLCNNMVDEKVPINNKREYLYQLKVLQTIIELELPSLILEDGRDNSIEVRKAIINFVEGDLSLYGYTFFVSSNQVFDYTWSYLRKKMSQYVEFLFNSNLFFFIVLRDINALSRSLISTSDIHIVFNDMIDVEFMNTKPFVKAQMLWNHFYNITKVRKRYQISIMRKESIIAVLDCSCDDNVETICKKILDSILKK